MPALVVAIAGKPASSITRALATSQTFGSSSGFGPRCICRKFMALSFCSSEAGMILILHVLYKLTHTDDGPTYGAPTNFLFLVVCGHSQGIEATVETFQHGLGSDSCAYAAGGAMLDIDRGSYRDLITFAKW